MCLPGFKHRGTVIFMMSDREVSAVIEDLKVMTLEDQIEWTKLSGQQAYETQDLDGFHVLVALTEASDAELRVDDGSDLVAGVLADDGRSEAQRATLEGAVFELMKLVRSKAGSEDKA